ncbi:winged helix-turn-helix transcriptional regulator [Pseudonocardia sp. TRM90224]|uniref:winged helix-turn-helix transcriptional regulator n=1 Tax=Pseudonocardia sp. TRM90224 TaxID=2812678 RepID=UPI001E4E9C4A|nr:helix-turn-helix domain-containing protein [Pseudonocardia sp. TRM90224]
MAGKRNYDDPCGMARALDIVGERWALHVVRELLLGPKRFSDLVRSLPAVSQNVLSQRLRELAEAGVLHRRRMGPPVSANVYELTDRGQELRPVVIELARWGSRLATTAVGELSADALAIAMLTTYDGMAKDALIELRLGEERFRAEIRDGRFDITRAETPHADAVITTDAAALRSVVFGGRPLDPSAVTGDLDAAQAFVRHFPRPAIT